MRDEFAIQAKEVLAKRVAQRCSNPGCRRPTSGPQDDPTKAINLGVAAHITAASPDGPRYDPALTSEQRGAVDNGIWLCQTCAKLIDNDESRYPVAVVRGWRRRAEAEAARDLERRPAPEAVWPFVRLERLIPELLAEMRKDLTTNPFRRQFVLLERGWMYWASGTEFAYYFEDHPDLEGKVRMLENSGLVRDITTKNVKRYLISEGLADYLAA